MMATRLLLAALLCAVPLGVAAQGLQALIDATPDGGTLDLTGRTFIEENTTLIYGRNDLTIIGGSVVAHTDGSGEIPWNGKWHRWPAHRMHINIRESFNITIVGMKIQGVNPEGVYDSGLELQHGFLISSGSSDITLRDVEVDDVWGDCVTFGGGGSNNTVSGADCDDIGRQGIAVTHAYDALIENVTFRHIARTGIDVEPIGRIGHEVYRLIVRGCTFYGPIGNYDYGHSGNGDIIDTWFEDNRFVGVPMRIKVGGSDGAINDAEAIRTGVYVNYNKVDTASPSTPIVFLNATVGSIIGNELVVMEDGDPGWVITNSTDIEVRDNIVNGDGGGGGGGGGTKPPRPGREKPPRPPRPKGGGG